MKSVEELLDSHDVVIPDNTEALKRISKQLRGKGSQSRSPSLFTKAEFFLKSPATLEFLQGDILSGIEPCWIEIDGAREGGQAKYSMIISCECDTENREGIAQEFIRLVPIYDEQIFLSEDASQHGNLRTNKYSDLFWIPNFNDNENGLVVNLSHPFSIDRSDFYKMAEQKRFARHVSLSVDAYWFLKVRLAFLYCRPPPHDTLRIKLEPI